MPTEAELEQELYDLRDKYEAAVHQMHKGEMQIRALEALLSNATEAKRLGSDRGTSTAHDFGLESGPGLSLFTQQVHLEALLAKEEREYEELRNQHAAAVTELTREGLELMSLLGDPTAPLGGIDLADARERLRRAVAGSAAIMPYDPADTAGGATIMQLPADSLMSA